MQTHHANSPGRGVAVMASREVLRICRRCWAGHVSRGYPRRSRSRPRSRSRSRSPRGRVVNFGGVLGDSRQRSDQIGSNQLTCGPLHFTGPLFLFSSSRTPSTSLPLGENNRNEPLRLHLHPIRHHHCGLVHYCLNLHLFRNEYCQIVLV
ncbi:uncharacterized protein K444DRAFT_196917 [Hyaloscypha bicolor E]|uniref:Uncharacterized protein n=1 Tax=Hyaloscypha bicolor E TaxID=1095630 RepID=A0A2J6SQI2_9HELO|nr:uncharacterized protein K444DRAFT_196917 [Hyaloscypha bicolor E]PMD53032.1 hypothetical protein K444DRAFT_196917 [Hyaloscypha bicolor E]